MTKEFIINQIKTAKGIYIKCMNDDMTIKASKDFRKLSKTFPEMCGYGYVITTIEDYSKRTNAKIMPTNKDDKVFYRLSISKSKKINRVKLLPIF